MKITNDQKYGGTRVETDKGDLVAIFTAETPKSAVAQAIKLLAARENEVQAAIDCLNGINARVDLLGKMRASARKERLLDAICEEAGVVDS